MRIGKAAFAGAAAAVFIVGGVTVYACAGGNESPTWELAKDHYDDAGSGAVLTPGNDTRVNLLLLLADRRGAPVRDPAAKRVGPPLVLLSWKVMAEATAPPPPAEPEDMDGHEGSRCQTQASGAAAFAAAVQANPQIPQDEKQRLMAARTAFVPDCSGAGAAPVPVAAASPTGKAFAAYVGAAADFYGGRFDSGQAAFAGLQNAPDPWLRETATYMVARNALNRAQQSSFDEYGSLAKPEQRDLTGLTAAGAAFDAYLKAYPDGRYASSARGLTRRAAWLGGNREALAGAIDRQLAGAGGYDGAATATAFVNEVDMTLLEPGGAQAARNPVLVAVADLKRMRCEDDYDTPAEDCAPRLGREELERQAPLFANDLALFGYLRAAEAYFVRHQPAEVLALIPDAARQKRFGYVEFSRQMLRGLALDATGDRNARGFWLSLFGGAVQPYQREALELALALHEERSGAVPRIFAPDSEIRNPLIRQILLEYVAGPDVLRRQARDEAVPQMERDIATYLLLAKELRHGFYRDFLGDVGLVPAGASLDSYYPGALYYDARYDEKLDPPPLGRFGPKAPLGDAGCPALTATVGRLAAAPMEVRPRLCLAEFFRANGFDDFGLDGREPGKGLGTSKPQFPGLVYQRLEVYKSVIADRAATDDDRALALNRAVRCYAPTGSNSCGGTEVGIEQRRAWYNRLKRDYPASRWARWLKFYW
jgi:hypothetical protein